MKTAVRITIPRRRRKQGKTNYKKRLSYLESGKHRLVLRKSLKNMTASIVDYDPKGDKILVMSGSQDLKKLGWNYNGGNMPSAYLIGYLLGKRASKKGVKSAVLDLGLQNPAKKTRLFAALAGVVDAGIIVAHQKEVLPSQERIQGEHIAAYASQSPNSGQFSAYTKNKVEVGQIKDAFAQLKKKIDGA